MYLLVTTDSGDYCMSFESKLWELYMKVGNALLACTHVLSHNQFNTQNIPCLHLAWSLVSTITLLGSATTSSHFLLSYSKLEKKKNPAYICKKQIWTNALPWRSVPVHYNYLKGKHEFHTGPIQCRRGCFLVFNESNTIQLLVLCINAFIHWYSHRICKQRIIENSYILLNCQYMQ